MRYLVLVGLAVLLFCAQSCGDDVGGLTPGSGNTFEAVSADSMSIDDIVTDASFPVVAPVSAGSFFPFHLMLGATAEYYHGRFVYNDGGAITLGRMSFKVVKNSASTAYFADWTVHRIVEVADPQTWSATLTADATEAVPAGHDATDNHIGIRNEFKRQLRFNINFTNNDYFSDVTNGSAVMSEDYQTMVAGDGAKLFFIATRQTSSPTAVSNNDLLGGWGSYSIFPNGSGGMREDGLSSDTFGGVTFDAVVSANVVDFDAVNGDNVGFVGEALIVDSDVGAFIYAEDDLGINLSSVDGVILVAPNKDLMLRFDLVTDNDMFACDKF